MLSRSFCGTDTSVTATQRGAVAVGFYRTMRSLAAYYEISSLEEFCAYFATFLLCEFYVQKLYTCWYTFWLIILQCMRVLSY